AGRVFRPAVRVKELARAFGLGSDRVVWVEPGPDAAAVPHAAPVAAFRPLAELVAYAPPQPVRLSAAESRTDPFPLPWPVLDEERTDDTDDEPAAPAPEPVPRQPARVVGPGWLARLARRFRRPVRESAEDSDVELVPETPAPPAAKERDHPKLASADALLHGHARAARRHELEARLLRDFP